MTCNDVPETFNQRQSVLGLMFVLTSSVVLYTKATAFGTSNERLDTRGHNLHTWPSGLPRLPLYQGSSGSRSQRGFWPGCTSTVLACSNSIRSPLTHDLHTFYTKSPAKSHLRLLPPLKKLSPSIEPSLTEHPPHKHSRWAKLLQTHYCSHR